MHLLRLERMANEKTIKRGLPTSKFFNGMHSIEFLYAEGAVTARRRKRMVGGTAVQGVRDDAAERRAP